MGNMGQIFLLFPSILYPLSSILLNFNTSPTFTINSFTVRVYLERNKIMGKAVMYQSTVKVCKTKIILVSEIKLAEEYKTRDCLAPEQRLNGLLQALKRILHRAGGTGKIEFMRWERG